MSLVQAGESTLLLDRRTVRRNVTLAVIAITNLCAWCCISLIGPFFPIEAAKKGTSETVIGFIYSSSELVIFLTSPVFGKLLSRFNPRSFYIAGLVVFGSCDIVFGFLNKLPAGVIFTSSAFAVRIAQAVGTAAVMTASFAIVGNIFSDKIGTAYGILETVTGLGFMLGPAVGGGLFQLGGFGLPFWVLGSCVLFCGCASCVFLPAQDHTKEERTGHSSLILFSSPLVWYGIHCLVAGVTGVSLWAPIFAQHLLQFNLNQGVIGLIFLLSPGVYSVTAPLWGFILDKKVPALPLTIIGLGCAAVNMLFFGPAPFFTFVKPELWLTLVTSALVGMTLAPVIISAMRCVVQGARDLGFEDDGSTFGLIGGIIQSSNSLGLFIGPTIGGLLADHYGFQWTMAVCSLLLFLPIICFSPFLVIRAYRTLKK